MENPSENQPGNSQSTHNLVADVQMTEQDKNLEESLALAKQLEEEDIQREVDQHMAEEEKQQQEGESISTYVNQSYAQQLMEMGFPRAVAEKALFMTLAKGGTTELALEWISEHSDDPDFNEELKIVGKDENAKPKSTLTKEEKLKKVKELQESIRKKRAEEEKKCAEEQERNRIKNAKEMTEVKRKMEEQQLKINLDVQKREKQEFLSAKQAMLEQLKRDKEERFNKKFTGGAGEAAQVVQKPAGPSGAELVKHGLKTVRTLYTEERQPGVAKTCFKTVYVYLTNALKDANEEKFKRINMGNEAFQKRVGKITGGLSLLKGAGFVEQEDGSLYLEHYDEGLLKEAHRLIENNL